MATIIISRVDNNKENMHNMHNIINDQSLIYDLNHLESEMRYNTMLGKLSRENFKILYANIVKIYDASFRYSFDENAQLYRSTILDVLDDLAGNIDLRKTNACREQTIHSIYDVILEFYKQVDWCLYC